MEDVSASMLDFTNDQRVRTSVEHRLGGTRSGDRGLSGGTRGGLMGVIAMVGVEDAPGW